MFDGPNTDDDDTNNKRAPELEDLLAIYASVSETHRYEGEGIWNRFNILVGLHVALFAVVAFTLSSQPPGGEAFVLALSIGGGLLSLWAIYVLRRLWLWHRHWISMLRRIEGQFPEGLLRPFTERPSRLAKSDRWYQSWLLAYTQPFMIVLFVIWAALVTLVATTDLFPDESSATGGQVHCEVEDGTLNCSFGEN